MKALQAWIERYFPCPFERGSSLLVIIGVASSLIYVYTKIGFKDDLQDLPQNLMVLTFLVSAWSQRRKIMSDLMFHLLVLAIVIPWILLGINALIDYETAIKYRSLNDLVKLFLFLPLAWWIGGSRAGAARMLIIAFLGLLTAIAMDPNLVESLQRIWTRQRVDFGIYNAQHGALFFSLVVVYVICKLGQRVHEGFTLNRGNILLILTGLTGLTGLLATRTRAAILGLLVAGVIVLVIRARQGRLFGRNQLSVQKGALVLVLVSLVLAWPAMKILHGRLAAEQDAIRAIVSGNLENVPFESVGIRIHSWVESLHWIAERPLTGWGQKARSDVIRLAESFPDDIKAVGYGHLHNGYLEILLGFGAVGFVFVGILWVVLLRRIRLAASPDLYAFALYSAILFLVMNLFESFFIYSSGEFAMALFFAGGYSQYLAKTLGGELPVAAPRDSGQMNTGSRENDSDQ